MRKPVVWLCLIVMALVAANWWQRQQTAPVVAADSPTARQAGIPRPVATPPVANEAPPPPALPAFLPPEAKDTLRLIASGGPFQHPQDGSVFGNREGRLPPMPRGYYREYTVETPGLDYRGARRIIAGGDPPTIYYYTDDHYDTFRPFTVPR